jgi:hypothetical protein
MLIGVCLVQTQPQRCATFAEVTCAHRWLTSLDLQGGSATCARASSRAHARWLHTQARTPRSSRSTATNVRAASPARPACMHTRASSTLAAQFMLITARAMSSYRTMRKSQVLTEANIEATRLEASRCLMPLWFCMLCHHFHNSRKENSQTSRGPQPAGCPTAHRNTHM